VRIVRRRGVCRTRVRFSSSTQESMPAAEAYPGIGRDTKNSFSKTRNWAASSRISRQTHSVR